MQEYSLHKLLKCIQEFIYALLSCNLCNIKHTSWLRMGQSYLDRIDMKEQPCSHVDEAVRYSPEELDRFFENFYCSYSKNECSYNGKNRWLCLSRDCQKSFCHSFDVDHAVDHFLKNRSHCIYQNLSSKGVWCYICEMEVHLEIRKPKGLKNIGNTCYMNSALQALCNIPAIRTHFTQVYMPISNDDKHCLSRSFQKLIKDMCQPTAMPLIPTGILNGNRSMHQMFRGCHQHDTQEFLRCFMDQLHDELKEQIPDVQRYSRYSLDDGDNVDEDGDQSESSTSSGNQSENDYETAADSGVEEGDRSSTIHRHSLSSSPIARTHLLSRSSSARGTNSPNKQKRKPPKYRSIISEVFDGKLLSSVQCRTCKKVSTRVENFQDLSLPIPNRDHVTMIHQGTLSPTSLASCSDVYRNRPSWVSWLWEWVKSLFWGPTVSLHDCLAAFFSDDELKGDNMYSCETCSKLRNGVKFSKVLDLPEVLCIHLKRFRHELAFSSKISNFVSFPLTDLDMRPYLNKDCKNKVQSYDLSSVICHHGTAGGGHYTCYAIDHITDQWYELNDERVTPVSSETVANCEGYVLFYRKNDIEMQNIRKESNNLLLKHMSRPGDLSEFFVSLRWFARLQTFAEPGKIDNADFLCPHGGVQPSKLNFIKELTVNLSGAAWTYLLQKFDGGPPCNQLHYCKICEEERIRIVERMKYELSQFKALKDDNRLDDTSPVMYAISKQWYRQWESFVHGGQDPPGPIDNSPIAVNVNGQRSVKPNSDFDHIPHDLYYFLWNIYGGGPEIVLKHHNFASSRASFSSGISMERERDRASANASKAKSVESLPVNGVGDMLAPQEPRPTRTQSVSSDSVTTKMAASAAATAHRKQQSLDNMRLERDSKFENDLCSKENQRKFEVDNKENEYCPDFTPDELDSYSFPASPIRS